MSIVSKLAGNDALSEGSTSRMEEVLSEFGQEITTRALHTVLKAYYRQFSPGTLDKAIEKLGGTARIERDGGSDLDKQVLMIRACLVNAGIRLKRTDAPTIIRQALIDGVGSLYLISLAKDATSWEAFHKGVRMRCEHV